MTSAWPIGNWAMPWRKSSRGSRAVRLPAAYRFEGSEVEIHRDPETGAVVLTPVRPSARAWLQERNALVQQPGIQDEIQGLLGYGREPSAPQERAWP
jgi:virulence-associated protein VagC